VATTKRTSSTPAKKRASATKKTAAKKKPAAKTTARKRVAKKAEAADPEIDEAAESVDEPVTAGTEARAVARPERPPMRPGARRAVFFDVENTSRAEDVERVLRHLAIDFAHGPLEFTAVGNWRVIGHDPARQLAAHGAALVHSAPSTGVRDWSDLRIAVAAGVWLAGAVPGDVVEIVSDDQAFDAVGDVAASRGVVFRRLSYRSLAGIDEGDVPESSTTSAGARPRRRRRGGRRNGRHRTGTAAGSPAPASRTRSDRAPDEIEGDGDPNVETAPVDEVVGVVQELVASSPNGETTLDAVAAALRGRGFRRRAGSPRLITRLKLIKDIEVERDGRIRVAGAAPSVRAEASDDVVVVPDDDAGEAASSAEAGATTTRRRRRRRRRPRGSGAGADSVSGEASGVDAAAMS